MVKHCSKCGEVKPLAQFARNLSSKDSHNWYCKKCMKNYNGVYNQEHKESLREYDKAYYQVRKEEKRARAKKRYEGNREELLVYQKSRQKSYRLADPELFRQRNRKYYAQNGEKLAKKRRTREHRLAFRKYNQERRARLKGCKVNDLSKTQISEMLLRAIFCVICGKPFWGTRRKSLDHVKPISRGGDNTLSNVQIVCISCNSKKGTKVIGY